ncbi:MAG: GAF domain-containing protein [Bacteroidota bacterium]
MDTSKKRKKRSKKSDSALVKSKYTRVILIPIIGLIIVSGLFIYSAYKISFNSIQERELKRLEAIVKSLDMIIDGDELELLFEEKNAVKSITQNDENETYYKIHQVLKNAQKSNNLPTDIYTLTKRKGAKERENSFFFGVKSGNPNYLESYTPPEKLFYNYEYGGLLEPYPSANGEWISAFSPIKNSQGKVVAVVEADLELTKFYEEAYNQLFSDVAPIAIVVIALVVIIGFLINYTIKQLVDLNQKEMIKTMGKLQSTQEVIKEYTQSIEEGEYDREINTSETEDGTDIIQSLQSMRSTLKKNSAQDEIRKWTNEGLAQFGEILRQNQNNMENLSYQIVSNIVKYTKSNQGGLFLIESERNEEFLELVACYAWERQKFVNKRMKKGEGLVGQCWLEKDVIFLTEIPDDYVRITSGLGKANPTSILIVPLIMNEEVFGILELASFQVYQPHEIDFVKKVGENVASTISTVKTNEQTQKLLEQAQEQSEQMRSQEEEMRQNMEELQATQEEAHRKTMELEKVIQEQKEEIEKSKGKVLD